jgi:hypothetical protein
MRFKIKNIYSIAACASIVYLTQSVAQELYENTIIFADNENISIGNPSWGTIKASVTQASSGENIIELRDLSKNNYAPSPLIKFSQSIPLSADSEQTKLHLVMKGQNFSAPQKIRLILNKKTNVAPVITLQTGQDWQQFDVDIQDYISSNQLSSLDNLTLTSANSNGWCAACDVLQIDKISWWTDQPGSDTPPTTDEPPANTSYEQFDSIFNGDLYYVLAPASWGNIAVSKETAGQSGNYVRFSELSNNSYAPSPVISLGTGKDLSNLRSTDRLEIQLDAGATPSDNSVAILINDEELPGFEVVIDSVAGQQKFLLDIFPYLGLIENKVRSIAFVSKGSNGWPQGADHLDVDEFVISKQIGTSTPDLSAPPAPSPDIPTVPDPGTDPSTDPEQPDPQEPESPESEDVSQPQTGITPFLITTLYADSQNFTFGGGWGGFDSFLRTTGGVEDSAYIEYVRTGNATWNAPELIRFNAPIDISDMRDSERLRIALDLGDFSLPAGPNFNLRIYFNNLSDNYLLVLVDNSSGWQTFYLNLPKIQGPLVGSIQSIGILPGDGFPEGANISGIKVDDIALVNMDGVARPPAEEQIPSTPTDHGIAAVWAVHDGEKIEQDDLDHMSKANNQIWDGEKIKIFAARNEIVAFQVIVQSSDAGIVELSAQLPELKLRDGTESIRYKAPEADPTIYTDRPIQVFSQHYLNVTQRTHADFLYPYDENHPAVPEDPLGLKPVSLVPENAKLGKGGFPIKVKPDMNQGLWFEIYVNKDLPAGVYEGQVLITGDLQQQLVPIELEVFDFQLPDKNSLDAMVYYEQYQPFEFHGGNDWSFPIDAAYHRLAHRNRVEFTDHYDEQQVLDHIGRFNGNDFIPAKGYEGPGVAVGNNIVPRTFYGSNQDFEDEESARILSDRWIEFMDSQFPGKTTFLYMKDEPRPEDYAGIQQIAQNIKHNPGIGRRLPILVTEPHNLDLDPADDLIDIWVTTSPDYQIETALAERASGDNMWTYNGWRPYAGALLIDTPAVDARVNAWACFKHNISTYYYWAAVNYNRQNIWINPRTFSQGRDYAMGDGVLVYPGQDVLHPDQDRGIEGPISTIQLANLRRGLQDHLYLTMARYLGLNQVVDQALATIVPSVFSDVAENQAVQFPQHGDIYEQNRYSLGKAIEQAMHQ